MSRTIARTQGATSRRSSRPGGVSRARVQCGTGRRPRPVRARTGRGVARWRRDRVGRLAISSCTATAGEAETVVIEVWLTIMCPAAGTSRATRERGDVPPRSSRGDAVTPYRRRRTAGPAACTPARAVVDGQRDDLRPVVHGVHGRHKAAWLLPRRRPGAGCRRAGTAAPQAGSARPAVRCVGESRSWRRLPPYRLAARRRRGEEYPPGYEGSSAPRSSPSPRIGRVPFRHDLYRLNLRLTGCDRYAQRVPGTLGPSALLAHRNRNGFPGARRARIRAAPDWIDADVRQNGQIRCAANHTRLTA